MESKKTFIVGLVVALALVWVVTSTTSASSETGFGSWLWVGCATPCRGTTDVRCDISEPYPAVCWSQNWVNVCNVNTGGYPTGYCDPDQPLDTPCTGNDACNNALNTHCG